RLLQLVSHSLISHWQRKAWLVELIRQRNGLLEKLRDALDGSAEFRRSVAQVRQRLLHARPELSWGALELCNLRQGRLVVDRLLTVQSEQDQHQLVHSPRQASGCPVSICTSRELARERSESEFGLPEVVLHDGLAQRLGVIRDSPLQHIEPRFGIE